MIRAARLEDRDEILDMVRAAFAHDGRDGEEEVGIVQATWELAQPDTVDLVAADGDRVVGHVLGAAGTVGDGSRLLAVAPLAVVPDRQGDGVGSALMRELLGQADAAGWPAVVLLGDPAYYSRFGFEPAGALGVVYPVVGADSPYFQLNRLGAYDGSIAGEFRYCWEHD